MITDDELAEIAAQTLRELYPPEGDELPFGWQTTRGRNGRRNWRGVRRWWPILSGAAVCVIAVAVIAVLVSSAPGPRPATPTTTQLPAGKPAICPTHHGRSTATLALTDSATTPKLTVRVGQVFTVSVGHQASQSMGAPTPDQVTALVCQLRTSGRPDGTRVAVYRALDIGDLGFTSFAPIAGTGVAVHEEVGVVHVTA